MLRKFRVRLNGQEYIVEMEELTNGGDFVPVQPQAVQSKAQVTTAKEENVATKEVSKTVGAGETINAPMPGTILSINLKEGDKVSKLQPVLVLEAMKMENQIVSPKDGIVTSILVQQGQAVDAGDVLFTID